MPGNNSQTCRRQTQISSHFRLEKMKLNETMHKLMNAVLRHIGTNGHFGPKPDNGLH